MAAHALAEQATFSLAPQFARLDYAGDNFVGNSNFFALVAHYRQAWLANWQPVLNASAWYGDEHTSRELAPISAATSTASPPT